MPPEAALATLNRASTVAAAPRGAALDEAAFDAIFTATALAVVAVFVSVSAAVVVATATSAVASLTISALDTILALTFDISIASDSVSGCAVVPTAINDDAFV